MTGVFLSLTAHQGVLYVHVQVLYIHNTYKSIFNKYQDLEKLSKSKRKGYVVICYCLE